MDYSPPGFSVHGIFHARVLKWAVISSSRGSSGPGMEPESLVSPALAVDSLPLSRLGSHIQLIMGLWGFPGGAMVKNLLANARGARDMGSVPGSGKFPGGGNGNTLQYSYLKNSMDGGACQAVVHGITQSHTRLSKCEHARVWVYQKINLGS